MNTFRLPFSCLALASLFVLASPIASGSELFAVNYDGSTPFFRVNQASGATTIIKDPASRDVGDLTSDNLNRVWGVVLPNTAAAVAGNALVTFNPVTGDQTSSTPITFAGIDPNETRKITSLAYDTGAGKLYGNTTPAFGESGLIDRLFEINPLTGVATFIGNIATATGGGFGNIFALGFNDGGGLYGVSNNTSELVRINPGTAAGASLGTVNDGGTTVTGSFDIAARPEDGAMFLVASGTHSLYTIDVLTAGLTLVGPYAGPGATNLVGLAFAVPEPGTWAMMLAGLALLGAVGARRARR